MNRRTKPWPSRRVWHRVHSWVGRKLHLVFALIVGSGALAVVAHEIDWLLTPEMRVTPGGARRSLGVLLDTLAAAHPEVALHDGVVLTSADRPRTAVRVLGVSPAGVRAYWIDPYTAAVRGDTPVWSPGAMITRLHTSLFIPAVGSAIVSLFALFLLTSLASGLSMYPALARGWRRWPRRDAPPRARLGGLHRLLGIALLPFTIVMTATGLFFFWDFVAVRLGAPERPIKIESTQLSAERLGQLGPATPRRLAIDALLEAARARVPGLVVTMVRLPQHAGDVFTVLGHRGDWLAGRHNTRLELDPYSGAIVLESVGAAASSWTRLHHAVQPLHFGSFAGLGSKLAWSACGVMLFFSVWTGLQVHRRRLAARGIATASVWQPAGGPMGIFKPLNVVLIGAAALGAVGFARARPDPSERAAVRYAAQGLGPWRAAIALIDEDALFGRGNPLRPGADITVIVDFIPPVFAAMRDARVALGSNGTTARARLKGRDGRVQAQLTLPDRLDPEARVQLLVTGWDGQRHTADWPMSGGARVQ